jgi:tetratricopeptide (TPR) repeat protein
MTTLLLLVFLPFQQSSPEIPELIAKMPPSVQKSFGAITKIIKEKGKDDPLAYEAYIARAQIWSTVGATEESLADYLIAGELGKKKPWTPGEQSRFFRLLQGSLKSIDSFPKGQFVADAQEYFYEGTRAFHLGQNPKALEFLDNALLLDPNHLEARSFRAILHHKMGHLTEASRDASVVAQRLSASNPTSFTRHEFNKLAITLEKVQGESRSWFTSRITAPPIEMVR